MSAGSKVEKSEAGPPILSRLVLGALAGMIGTAAMTATMRRLHARLPPEERYPLPPREITQRLIGGGNEDVLRDASLAAHFAYGAGAGALIAAAGTQHRTASGALNGAAVWAGSYFGWVPALKVLKIANHHPPRRNMLMIGVHLVWGATTILALKELAAARGTILAQGPLLDKPEDGKPALVGPHDGAAGGHE